MKLTEKQKKLVWVAGGVLVAIHYAPGIVNTVRQQIAAYSFAQARPLPNPAAGRVSSAPPSPAPPPPAPSPEEIQATQLAASVGIWGGAVPRPNPAHANHWHRLPWRVRSPRSFPPARRSPPCRSGD